MHWRPVARAVRLARPRRSLSVLLLALMVSWLAAGTPVRAVRDAGTAQRPADTGQAEQAAQPGQAEQARQTGQAGQPERAEPACAYIGSPGGPARCDHGGDHGTAGRLHPSGIDQDATGTGYPADGPAAAPGHRRPTDRPPSRPSLAQLQVWRH